MLLPPTQPSSLSIASINAAAKSILASSEPPLAKQDRLAALSERALASGRTRSAQLAFDHALRRWRKWRATKPVPLSRSLLLAGLRSAAARRDKAAYEELLLSAQESWEVDLTHEPRLLSGAMVGCSEAGWLDNARACNMTIVAAGLVPTTAAVNAFMAAQLRAGDTDGVLDAFIHLRQHGPPADRQSQALAMRAAASRKASWNALRNLMRRSWLKIPWNAASANAAVGEFVSTGNLRAAAGVLGHMQSTRMPLRLESLERLLGHTALACGSSPTSLRVFSAMQQHVGALGALAKGAREAGKEEANEKKAEAAGRGVGQGEHDQQPQQQPQPQPQPSAARAAADGATLAAAGRAAAASASVLRAPPLSMTARLLMLCHLSPSARIPFCVRALAELADPASRVLAQATIALVLAAEPGGAVASAAWLTRLYEEGVDLAHVAESAQLGALVDALVPTEYGESLEGLLETSPALPQHALKLTSEEAALETDLREERLASEAKQKALEEAFKLAVRRQGRKGEDEDELAAAAAAAAATAAADAAGAAKAGRGRKRSSGSSSGSRSSSSSSSSSVSDDDEERPSLRRTLRKKLYPESLWALAVRACGSRIEQAEALCAAAAAVGELSAETGVGVSMLEEMILVCGRARDPSAAVLTLRKLEGRASPEAYVSALGTCCADEAPNMALADGVLDMMQGAGALDAATPGQLLRLFVGLVRGYGRSAALEEAHGAFKEGLEWLEMAQQQQIKRRQQQQQQQGPVEGAESEWEDAEWRAAERALTRVMVDAAVPHPRGLLLACTLLERLERRSGQGLKHGYYNNLISGHATAHDLHVALGALQQAQGLRGVSASGYRVTDATIATLMDALTAQAAGLAAAGGSGDERLRASAVNTLSSAGLQLDQKVAAYLASGGSGKMRGARPVNANDEILSAELGGLPVSTRDAERRAAARGMMVAAWSDADEASYEPAPSEQRAYDEFEKLLAQREDRVPRGDPNGKPERDTKKAVDARRLTNMQPGTQDPLGLRSQRGL